uniref:Uncharacterized protein n=1 Tax=Setaria viridis TaxID=4556 RepID=A0A4U6TKN5_SETVI|nr:hypothetical protein SEVIR_8G187200v2 [Setaria viridis]
MLRGEGAPRGRGSRTLGLHGPRSGGRGGSGSRAGGGGRGGGGSKGASGSRGAGSSGGRSRVPATRPLFVGSLPDGAGSSGGRSGGRSYGRRRRSSGRGVLHCDNGKYSECKKFQYGVLDYIDHLEEMFHDVVVDGSTSFVAGCEEDEDQDGEDVQEEDQYGPDGFVNEYEDGPVSNSNKKRASITSTKSTATSPRKKSKSPLMKMVSSLVEKLSTSDKDDNLLRNVGESLATSLNEKRQKLNPMQEMVQSVKKCQQLALECGATLETVEFYAGRHLFKDPYEREIFCNIPTPEGRLLHLKRYCKENNIVE